MNRTGSLIAQLKSTSLETKSPTGSFEAILSVPTLDRDKEIVDANCFSPLPDHITIDLDHAMTVEKTVASGRPFYDGELLKFQGTFASTPLAQMTRTLVDEGHIRTMSVAYMNALYVADEQTGIPHLIRGELLNAGIVAIPSNREALITASKALADASTDTHSVQSRQLTIVGETGPELVVPLSGAHVHTISTNGTNTHVHTISTETNPEPKAAAAASAAAADSSGSRLSEYVNARVDALSFID